MMCSSYIAFPRSPAVLVCCWDYVQSYISFVGLSMAWSWCGAVFFQVTSLAVRRCCTSGIRVVSRDQKGKWACPNIVQTHRSVFYDQDWSSSVLLTVHFMLSSKTTNNEVVPQSTCSSVPQGCTFLVKHTTMHILGAFWAIHMLVDWGTTSLLVVFDDNIKCIVSITLLDQSWS